MPKVTNLKELNSLEELQMYCTREGIRNFNLMQKDKVDDDYEYHRGLATAFFWITSLIDKGVIPKESSEDEVH